METEGKQPNGTPATMVVNGKEFTHDEAVNYCLPRLGPLVNELRERAERANKSHMSSFRYDCRDASVIAFIVPLLIHANNRMRADLSTLLYAHSAEAIDMYNRTEQLPDDVKERAQQRLREEAERRAREMADRMAGGLMANVRVEARGEVGEGEPTADEKAVAERLQ